MKLAQRVLARHLLRTADVVGDPRDLLAEFKRRVSVATRKQSDIPAVLELQKAALDPSHPQHEEAQRSRRNKLYEFVFGVTHGYDLVVSSGRDLFLTILQVYELTPKQRKEVEAASKFFSRRGVNKPDIDKAVETYQKYVEAYNKQIAVATEVLASGKKRGEGGVEKGFPAGPFTLVNTGGFSPEVVAEAAAVVEKAAQLLTAKGLGRVCYGDVHLSNRLSRGNVLAFYQVNSDELFIRSGVKGTDVVRTVLHELAHRLHFKFMKGKDGALRAIYDKLSRASSQVQFDPDARPTPGDTITEKGKTYEATGTTWRGTNLHVTIIKKGDPNWKGTIPLLAWMAARSKAEGGDGHAGSFVTTYAKTSYEENFAEMVAYYCLGKLPDDQVEMLKAIL